MGRRQTLVTIAALGGVASLAGMGVFAASSDRATTGDNRFETAERAREVDLRIAKPGPNQGCGNLAPSAYTDDLTSGLFAVEGAEHGFASDPVAFCLRNEGTEQVDIFTTAIDVVDEDLGCTGDEAERDTDCKAGDPGELASAVSVFLAADPDCDGDDEGATFDTQQTVHEFATGERPVNMGFVRPGGTTCMTARAFYGGSDALLQISQSDRLVWKLAFDGVAS